MCSDNNLQCTPVLSSADIVATLGSVEDNDSDDAGDELPVVTYSQACSALRQSSHSYCVLIRVLVNLLTSCLKL